jgi:hypothetical protein
MDHGDGERIWFEMTVTLKETARGTLITLRQRLRARVVAYAGKSPAVR